MKSSYFSRRNFVRGSVLTTAGVLLGSKRFGQQSSASTQSLRVRPNVSSLSESSKIIQSYKRAVTAMMARKSSDHTT
jgi:hypothetical protein